MGIILDALSVRGFVSHVNDAYSVLLSLEVSVVAVAII
jgi:hypothetical protein